MKIMTFNTQHCLNYITRQVDYEIMAQTIRDQGADICGLNEMFSSGNPSSYPNQTKNLSELSGLTNYYFAEAVNFPPEGPYGNGFISKYPILEASTIKIPDPSPKKYNGYYETRCVLKAKIEGGYTVLVCHFGLNPDEQENAVSTILGALENEKCILMGDFNVTPDNSVLDPIRKRMKDASAGFCDGALTFPSDKPEIKIDYIFVSPDIEVVSSCVPEIIASDHRVHLAEIR